MIPTADNAKASQRRMPDNSLIESLILQPDTEFFIILTPIKIITGTDKAIVSLSNVCVILTSKGALPVNQSSKE